jgi:drug/metabolite transporter (DMT)-like permease
MMHTLTPRRWLVLLAMMLTASLGDTFLDIGMKRIGPISVTHWSALLGAVMTPWVVAGILMLLGFLASQMTALSWADLTFVLPMTSLSYVMMVLLARFWLHEHVTAWRWAGVALIVAGVGFVAAGPSLTTTDTTPKRLP